MQTEAQRRAKAKYRKNNKEKIALQNKKYKEENKDKIKESSRDYYERNKEEINKKKKIYKKENKDKISEQNKQYKNSNKDIIKEKSKIRYKNNKDRILKVCKIYRDSKEGRENKRRLCAEYRAKRISTSDGTITKESLQELKELQKYECAECNIELEFDKPRAVHLDHFIPLSKGGTHTIGNVRYTCQKCNIGKSANIPDTLNLI